MTDNLRELPVWEHETIQWFELAPGVAVPTLATDALFAYICGHGAAHLWARLRWRADVAALLAREPDGGDRLWHAVIAVVKPARPPAPSCSPGASSIRPCHRPSPHPHRSA
jgi:hypothetical protein